MDLPSKFKVVRTVVKVVFIVLFVAQICNWLAFCTTSWFVSGQTHIGLWRACSGSCVNLDGVPDFSRMAVQAFAIFGYVAVNIAFAMVALYIFGMVYRNSLPLYRTASSVLVVAAVSWLISVVVFGIKTCSLGDKYSTCHYSYGLAASTAILSLIAAIITMVDLRGHGIVVGRSTVQVETTVTVASTHHEQRTIVH